MAAQQKQTKYETDIVIIGGGPATLGLLTNAVKHNKLQELVNGGMGIVILEAGLAFGGGNLQNFAINSNTSANGFIKCLYKKKDAPVPPPKPEGSPVLKKLKNVKAGLEEMSSDEEGVNANTAEYIATPPFKDLYKHSPIIQMAFEFGPSCIPLSAIGMVLNFAGNHLLHFIYKTWKRKIFFPMTRVTGIQLLSSGEIIVSATRTECQINLADGCGGGSTGSFEVVAKQETQITFKAKSVLFSQGGRQVLHPEFFSWFPKMKERKSQIITSDEVLQRKNFAQLLARLKREKIKKIVIIGGSHSGFSSAWLLLNGPADVLNNTHVKPSVRYRTDEGQPFKFPDAVFKTILDCPICCYCKVKQKGCPCVCKCFSFFKYEEHKVNYQDLPQFAEADIKIIYRDQIKVFYCKVAQAERENYNEYKANLFTNKNGYLYSFTGLRGDAKKLYQQIKEGQEKRVKLVKCATVAEQNRYVEGADLVIWATGYQTNELPIRDAESKVILLQQKQPFTQYDVDSRCRLITSDNALLVKCFGSGLAFPMRTNDGMTQPDSQKANPRADSFSLYMNFVANTVLGNLLPKYKLDSKLQRIQRADNKIAKGKAADLIVKAQQSTQIFKTPEKSHTKVVVQAAVTTDFRKKAADELVRASSQGNSQRASQIRYQKSNGTYTPSKASISDFKKRKLEQTEAGMITQVIKLSQTQIQSSIREIPDNFQIAARNAIQPYTIQEQNLPGQNDKGSPYFINSKQKNLPLSNTIFHDADLQQSPAFYNRKNSKMISSSHSVKRKKPEVKDCSKILSPQKRQVSNLVSSGQKQVLGDVFQQSTTEKTNFSRSNYISSFGETQQYNTDQQSPLKSDSLKKSHQKGVLSRAVIQPPVFGLKSSEEAKCLPVKVFQIPFQKQNGAVSSLANDPSIAHQQKIPTTAAFGINTNNYNFISPAKAQSSKLVAQLKSPVPLKALKTTKTV